MHTTHSEDTTMLQQFNSQFIAASKQFSDTLFKAHTLALEGFERITDLNLKALDGRVQATTEFFTTATESNDVEGFKNAFPKGVNLIKEHSEKLYNNGQEVLGVTLKTTEALTQLAKAAVNHPLGVENLHSIDEVSAALTRIYAQRPSMRRKRLISCCTPASCLPLRAPSR